MLIIHLTGDSVAIYSSGWSFYNQGMRSVFFLLHTVNLFRPRFLCHLGFRWNPWFCADLHYSGNGVLSRRGRGARLAVSLASLTSRVPVQQPCRRSNHQLGFLAGSFVHAPDAPPWSRRLPIPVPISARLVHGQGFHGFPPTSDPAPTRVPPRHIHRDSSVFCQASIVIAGRPVPLGAR